MVNSKANIDSDQITNNSSVIGHNVSDALSTANKEVDSFVSQTTAFTISTNANKVWYDCNFSTNQNVTIQNDSLGIGQIMYFKQSGAGLITFVESGITLSQNLNQSFDSQGQGDITAIIKTADTLFQMI